MWRGAFSPASGESDDVHHEQAVVAPHGAEGRRRDDGAPVSGSDGSGAERVRRDAWEEASARGDRDGAWFGRQHGARHQEEPVGAVGRRSRFRLEPDEPRVAAAVPRLRHHRQQHRRAERGGVHGAGDRRRPLPVERRVPHPDASEADAGIGRTRRHVAGSDLREAVRPGDADSVDAALH